MPRRLIAYVIDLLVVTLIVFIAATAVLASLGPAVSFPAQPEASVAFNYTLGAVNALVAILLNAAYFVASWSTMNATWGQRLLGLRLTAAPDGGDVGARQSVGRWLLLGAPFPLATWLGATRPTLGGVALVAASFWYLVLLVTAIRGRSKQGIHDRFARTVVIREPETARPAGRRTGTDDVR